MEELTPITLRDHLVNALPADAANDLAEKVRDWFGPEALREEPQPKVDEVSVAWAIESPEGPVAIVSDAAAFALPLMRLGTTNVYAGVAQFEHGHAMRWTFQVGSGPTAKRFLPRNLPKDLAARYGPGGAPLEVYARHPQSLERRDAPKGTLDEHLNWQSRIYPNTVRDWWTYVPAQYDSGSPACVMVFQDGAAYKDYVPVVFDNLIASREMPVTVAVFVSPGLREQGTRDILTEIDGISGPLPPLNGQRQLEYDTISDRYARFILEEILPEVERSIHLRHDATSRAIAGLSSGAVCAFTVAWERPDTFSKVLSSIGSYTNIPTFAGDEDEIAGGPETRKNLEPRPLARSGHDYPSLLRMTPRKPIRVFLQDGENDLNTYPGNWWLANQEMASALTWAGYDLKVTWGKGFHSGLHMRAILPDALKWLWRDVS